MTVSSIPNGHITTPKGFLAAATSAGIKTKAGALDLGILISDRACATAGVFTRNLVRSAPVIVTERRLKAGGLRGVIVNSGCANALTGERGIQDAETMASLAAGKLGLPNEAMGVASTGVTGVALPLEKISAGIQVLSPARDGGADFARAILTTDTRAKEVALSISSPSGEYSIAGCAKGSGMIHPDMATMLAYVTTDASIDEELLREVVADVTDSTLNMLTIDGDTSCSDTFLTFANGASGLPVIEHGSEDEKAFREGLLAVCTHLARELARDGEGASRLIEVEVSGAASLSDARRVAKTIALSSLVKTAMAGSDPNWGRILVAAGRSGARVEERLASLSLQGRLLFERGMVLPFDEAEMRSRLNGPEVLIRLDLGLADATATAWGCDLTTDYVHINADYTT